MTPRSALLALALLLTTQAARAARPDKAACLASFVEAQKDRQSGALVAARKELLVCSDDACPAVVRGNCGKWLGEVEASTPTVVVAAREADGKPVLDVRVTIDGAPFAAAIDGTARPVDPGVHAFRFDAGDRSATVRLAVIEGKKDQLVEARFAPLAPALAPAAVVTPLPEAPRARPVPASVFVFGGLTLVGAGVFTGFGLAGRANLAALDKAGCAPHCNATNPGNVSAVRRDDVIADVGLGVAVVSLGLATFFYLSRPAATR